MSNLIRSLLVFVFVAGCTQERGTEDSTTFIDGRLTSDVIYGADGRSDLYEVNDPGIRALADSTVVLVKQSQLTQENGQMRILGDVFGQSYGLCASEPFRDQEAAGFCSGFLVSSNTIVTAGHCIQTLDECRDTKFVFGYGIRQEGTFPSYIQSSEVYGCSRIVHSQKPSNGADFAVVTLDRPVQGHLPLGLRVAGEVGVGAPLVVIGHPVGLPTKVTDGGQVRSLQGDYFVANLDTYGGNSGSAVFNRLTGLVEGILVRGEVDFVSQGACRVSKQCADSACRGEDVTKISQVLPFLTPTPVPSPSPLPSPSPSPSPVTDAVYGSTSKVSIPDNTAAGITSSVNALQVPSGRKVLVTVDIAHTYRGDLRIDLISPNGSGVILLNRSGGSTDNVRGTFGLDLVSSQSMSGLSAVTSPGAWKLRVYDLAGRDVGVLNSWKLTFKK